MKGLYKYLIILVFFNSPHYLMANEGAKQIVSMGASMALMNAVTNSGAMDAFNEKCGAHPVFCGLAALAAIGVVSSLGTAKKIKGIEGELDCAKTNSCFSGGGGDPYNPYTPGGPGSFDPNNPLDVDLVNAETNLLPNANRTLNDFRKRGGKVNPDGSVTTPGGKRVGGPGGSGSLAAAGLSKQEQQIAEDIMKEVAKEGESLLAKYKGADEEFSGGTGGGGVAAYGKNRDKNNKGSFSFGKGNLKNQKNPVAGLSVNHGSDKIGVSGDDLFIMVHRKYQDKKSSMRP